VENHWNSTLLDSIETVLAYARTMTWKGLAPVVKLVTTAYKTGVKLTQQAMNQAQTQHLNHEPQTAWNSLSRNGL
jgi:hypothetical protein